MEDNVLKVKLVAETSDYEKDMKDAGEATEKFGDESKKSSTALEKLQKTINEQKTRLKALKDEYTDLILAQDKSDKSTKDLESKMKLLNAQLLINEKRLQAANAASNSFTSGLGNSGQANEAMGELHNTLANIRNLQMADVFISLGTALAASKDRFRAATSGFKQAFEEIGGVFNFRDFDVGDDGIKGIFQSMKIQGKEAISSLSTGFKNLGGAIKAAMTSAAAAVAAVIAVVVGLIAAINNAIRTAQRLKTQFFEAQKIGMSNASYEEWAYVMGQVGIEADKLSDFLKTLADEQNNVRDGTEDITEAFKKLGLSAKEVSSMSQEKLFTETVKRLQQVENEVERTSLAYRIFGEEDAAQLMNILRLTNDEIERMTNNFYLLGGSTSDSAIEKSLQLSNSISNMKLAWQGLTTTLAEAFMPVITAVVDWLTVAIAKINMFVRAMLGYDIISQGSKSTESATNGINNYSNALDKATESATKLRRTTQGFDELNIVADPASRSSSSAAGTSTGSYGSGYEIPEINMGLGKDLGLEKFAEDMERLKDIIRNVMPWALVGIGILLCFLGGPVGWITGLSLMGLGIGVGIESGAWAEQFAALGEGIKNVWKNIKSWFVENVKPVFTKQYWVDLWANVKEAVAISAIGQAIAKGWNAIAKWFGENVKPVFTLTFWKQKWEVVSSATSQKMDEIKSTISGKWQIITKWFGENVKPVFTVAYWKNKWEVVRSATSLKLDEIKNKISEKWNVIKKWFADNVKPVFTVAYWKNKFEVIRSAAGQKMEEIKNKIDEKWQAIKKWFAENVKPIFTATYWVGKWNTVKQGATSGMNNIGNAIFGTTGWGKIKTLFTQNIAKIFTKQYWVQKWNTAKQGAIDGVKAFINGIIAKIESGINGIVRKLNGIGKINIPEWLGGGSFGGFNLKTITIPRLATGGIATRSTLANIGENGREAVLPLENNTGWMDMLADRIAARNQTPTKIVLKVGEKELGWASINSINNITKQTGGLQLHLV